MRASDPEIIVLKEELDKLPPDCIVPDLQKNHLEMLCTCHPHIFASASLGRLGWAYVIREMEVMETANYKKSLIKLTYFAAPLKAKAEAKAKAKAKAKTKARIKAKAKTKAKTKAKAKAKVDKQSKQKKR